MHRIEGQEREQPNDVHPKGAYRDGEKLAIVGCECRHCVQEMIDRDTRRRPQFDQFKL